jgi:catechol 2,3-dioxygenase-like lactoylglutathione lyase family enzyme
MVTRVLHCNFNTADVEAALAFYVEGLGLSERMRSVSDDGDSTALGLPQKTRSIASFAYDYRGGRVAPAAELVEWIEPTTAGEAYATPSAIGMQAAGFAVASVDDAVAACVAAGGRSIGARLQSADAAVAVDAVVADPDGVAVELWADTEVPSGRFRSVRLSVNDLAVTTAWYEAIGFKVVGGPVVGRFESEDPTWRSEVTVQRMVPGVLTNIEVHLTRFEGVETGRAHELPHMRGLYRMACAVEDVRKAVASTPPEVQPGEPSFIPLHGTPLGGLWVAFMKDPDGVTIEFVERPLDTTPRGDGSGR